MTPTPTPPNPTSTSLLLRLKTQDEAAWERFVSVYGPLIDDWIRRWFARHGQPEQGKEDIVQEILASIHQYIGNFQRRRKGSFRKWLHRVTDSRVADYMDGRKIVERNLSETELNILHRIHDLSADPVAEECEDEKIADRRVLLETIVRTIQTDFKPNTWRAFFETVVNGRPTAEVADELGMSSIAVRQARRRIKRRIEDEFGELME